MVTREYIAQVLNEIALLLELKGENPFKIRAYRTGAEVVESYPGDIVAEAAQNDPAQLSQIKGIGEALAAKIVVLVTTGELEFYSRLCAEFPETIFDLFDIQGLGPKKIKTLYNELGVDSVPALKEACESGRVLDLPGFAKKGVDKILAAIEFHEKNASRFRLGEIASIAESMLETIRQHPDCSRSALAGSYRRAKETVHDIDLIVASNNPEAIMDFFVNGEWTEEILSHGNTKSSIRTEKGAQCDLRVVSNDEFPFALAYFTGSKEHNVALRSRARKLGYTLNEYRLAPIDDNTPEPPEIHDETELYEALGLAYVDPALRENNGEIEAAEEGTLPNVVELENIRGTFHCHTTASDGKNTLEEMADTAMELGLQYLGIADHSKSSVQANGLDETRLCAQIEQIRELNETFEGRFKIFAGSEVDILRDGALDFSDAILAELDYAVASVHSLFNLGEKDMTERIMAAIENPYITMLGHLTGRLLLSREPYAVNVPAIIEAAAETGTIIELNSNPWRLDMDWRWWKLAKEKGVKCAINPDAHRAAGLQNVFFGVRLARKGWLTKDDVINCLPLGEIESALRAKRLSLAAT
ncbi:MAG: DNA polymerase/3'-5' exonuclease PolX [Verrucomicrobiota bacterium]